MFTSSVTISLDEYDYMKDSYRKLQETLEKQERELEEARNTSRDFLLSLFKVEYLGKQEIPTVSLNYVPGLVEVLNEVLAANPSPTGTCFEVSVPSRYFGEEFADQYVGFSFHPKTEPDTALVKEIDTKEEI